MHGLTSFGYFRDKSYKSGNHEIHESSSCISWFQFLIAAALVLGLAAATLALHPQEKRTQTDQGKAAEAIRLNNLGVAYMNQRRSEAALKNFEQAYALDPNLLAAYLNEGIALLDLQRLEPAGQILVKAAEQRPKDARAWFNLGLLHRKLDETEQALAAFGRVAQLDPNDADTHYFLGALHQSARQLDLAIASYRRALELNPYHLSAQFGLATAYQRMGNSEEARKQLDRFQKLTQEKLGTPIGTTYGDQGKYSLAEDARLLAGAAAAPVAVQFVAVPSAESGLPSVKGRPVEGSPRLPACFLDYNNDGRADLLLLNDSSDRKGALYRNDGGRFTDATAGARLAIPGRIFSYVAGDYDNDGWTDIVVALDESSLWLYHNEGNGTFRDVTDASGLAAVTASPFALNFVDYDHDGDLDLYATRRLGEPKLWRNNGNSTFTDISSTTLPAVPFADSQMSIVTDFDNDRAVDLIVTHSQQSASLLRNPREGRFQVTPLLSAGSQPATRGVVAFDFDKDGWMDLAFTHAGSPGLSLWRNIEGKRLEALPLPKLNWTDGWGLAAVDYDNDGWIDLAAVGMAGSTARITLLRNEGSARFRDLSRETGLDKVSLAIPGSLATADYDSDGDPDILVAQDGSPPLLLRNDGGNKNNCLRLSLKALADNRSAIGTKVEVFAGVLYQKFEVQSSSGYLGQNAPQILAGLGDVKEADIVRMLWPTGVLQDEVQLAAGRAHQLAENDRRGSSCPILFAWNGARYEFISDLIGPGIVGHWVAPGERNTPDPTEYVKVAGSSLRARQGRLSLRLLEPMEEVVYLDKVRLIAVDHPADVEVYPNERFASVPPFPDFQVIASRGARLPLGAWDDHGRDLRRELRAIDRSYVTGFRSLPFKGFAELHGIELELGAWDPAQPLRLLMHGLTDYFTATSVYAAHQAGILAIPPYLEAQDAAGRWSRVVDDLGFPAGLARTMVADLTGRLPAGTKRVRILTNLKIYWDQILLDTTPEANLTRMSEVPFAEAALGFRGYPREVRGDPPSDIRYVYEEVSRTGPYAQHAGNYTRYGDALALLGAADDRFAILGSGDEVQLEFDSSRLVPVPAGWTRDYFFYADGFAKDMDFYAAHGYSVEPLPFHTMRGYPYVGTETFPREGPYLQYQLDMNTRQVSGRGATSFRFDYRREPAAPQAKRPEPSKVIGK
jgi:tetratricopeptide (TPR) repeat protein